MAPGESIQPAEGPFELELLTASLRADAADLSAFVEGIAVKLEDAIPNLVRVERARSGDGQFVQIVAEPGLGKSRLVDEFHARLGETPHSWVEWSSSQLLQNTPLHPLAEWGRLRFGGSDIAADKRFADLERALADIKLDARENAALLAPLLDIPLPDAQRPKFPPEELRRRQLAAVAAWILSAARAQPLVRRSGDIAIGRPVRRRALTGPGHHDVTATAPAAGRPLAVDQGIRQLSPGL